MTLHDLVAAARDRLRRAGIDANEAAIDAEYLARWVLGWDRARYFAALLDTPPDRFSDAYAEVVRRRERREPVAYIVGSREFWGLEFHVSPGVLVPRPESELIVQEALACLEQRTATGADSFAAADVGTGSGCLAISLAVADPRLHFIATDISLHALAVAASNASRHGVNGRVSFVETDLLAGIAGRFGLIVSNPPYVPSRDRSTLPPDVVNYEPLEALFGGDDGLAAIRRLLPQAAARLEPGGCLVFEFGFGEEEAVRSAVTACEGLSLMRIVADLQGIPRTAVARRL